MRRLLKTASLGTLAATAILIQPAFGIPETTSTANAVLAANHAAVGAIPTSGGAELDYTYSGDGLTGTRHDIVDLHSGAFVTGSQADIVAEASGFDGKTPWMRDTSGANTAQEGGDRIALAVNEAYRRANLWWRPGYAGATVTYDGRAVVDQQTVDQLTITPLGGRPFGAGFDVNTHLLVQISEDRQFFHTRTLFADYRPEHGLLLAHRITLDNGTGEAGYDHFELTRFSIGTVRPSSAYARPTAPPTGGSIEDGSPSVSLPFRLLNNHIYIDVSVNGKGPFTFIVDTGGHCLIAPELVSQLGLKIVGAAPMSGAGEKTGQFDRAGMWINAKPDGYLVTEVSTGGPAAEAGIQAGDLITRLDGTVPKFEQLSQARSLLRSRPAGTQLAVELRRGDAVKQVTLVLKDQI